MLMGHISPQAGFCQCPNFAQFLKMGGVQKNELHYPPTLSFGVDVVVGVWGGSCYTTFFSRNLDLEGMLGLRCAP